MCIRDRSNPVRVGNITLASGENNAYGVAVSGRYAYIPIWTVPSRLVVVDVSNPFAPVRVGNVTFASGEDSAMGIAVSGSYAYLPLSVSPTRLVVIDVSNPFAPVRVGNVTFNSGENDGRTIAVVGRYAYIPTPGVPSRLIVVDISNSSGPVRAGGVTLASGENFAYSVAVSGRYAYMPTGTSPASLVAVDISNASAPQRVGNATLASGEDTAYGIAVSGRYVYLPTVTSPSRLIVVELPSIQAPSAEIGSLNAGQLSVSDSMSVSQNVDAGSLTVGSGGLLVQGDAATRSMVVNGSFEVPGRFLVNASSNRIEFGSRAANTTLFVNGSINATGAITSNSGFDLAEAFIAEEPLLPGELVVATGRHTVRKATSAQAHAVIGAVSTSPGFVLDSQELWDKVFVGLAGRIPVKVTGTVRPGDFITISETPGVGKAATDAGFVIGRALSDVRGDGTVTMLIQPMYFSPQVDASGSLRGSLQRGAYVQRPVVASESPITRSEEAVVINLADEDVLVVLG